MSGMKDAASGMTTAAADTIEKAKDIGRDTIDKGYEGAGEYASKSLDYAREVAEKLAELAQRQPWGRARRGICDRLRCRANTQKAFVVNQMSLAKQTPDALSNLGQLALNIQRRPLRAMTLSVGAGFTLGGGLRSRLGLALGLAIGDGRWPARCSSARSTLYPTKMEDKIDTIRNALEEARQSLHQTVAELNQKVATVSTHLEPERLVERHLLLAACIAAALGFATGKSGGRLVGVATLVLGGLLGAVLTEASNHGFRNHDTTAT